MAEMRVGGSEKRVVKHGERNVSMRNDEGKSLELLIESLYKELGKKATFEMAVSTLIYLFRDRYQAASSGEQHLMYLAACRAATLLQSRYTSPGFWAAGLRLFEQAERVVDRPAERKHLQGCIDRTVEVLREHQEREDTPLQMRPGTSSGYLFEGQLSIGPEPPNPPWLVAQTALANIIRENVERLSNDRGNVEGFDPDRELNQRLQEIVSSAHAEFGSSDLGDHFVGLEEAIQATLQEMGRIPRGPPPASKEEVAKLAVISVTPEVLGRVGEGTECAVCREVLVVGDTMQEMPCKHSFHPDCLKTWLDAHNSCPICRYELRTDDIEYELQKELDREAEEDRKAYENSRPGGEYMYI